MATTTITYTGELIVMTCWCGMQFAIPRQLRDTAQRNGNYDLWCPLGHEGVYYGDKKTREEQAIARAEQAERRAADEAARRRAVQDQLDAANRTTRAYKGHLTRIKNRIANGVCPVPGCKRTGLTQTRRHIETKHPEWCAEHPEALG